MNTLTKFIDLNFSNLTHTDSSKKVKINEANESARYEIIENETLNACNLNDLTISGSLFSLTTFSGVTFESCVFYGSKLENCTFIDCKFINCNFEFTGITHCNFRSTEFKNCKWNTSPIKKNKLNFCLLDHKTSYYLSKEDNYLWECTNTSSEMATWTEILGLQETKDVSDRREDTLPSPELIQDSKQENQEQTATLFIGVLLGKLKKFAA